MALGKHRVPDIDRALTYTGPHGNLSAKVATLTVPATATENDTLDFMVLPVGVLIVDAMLVVRGALGADVTLALGLAQIPGHKATCANADVLIAPTAAATAMILRRNNAEVQASPKLLLLDDSYLVQGVIGGDDVGASPVPIDCIVKYINIGTP